MLPSNLASTLSHQNTRNAISGTSLKSFLCVGGGANYWFLKCRALLYSKVLLATTRRLQNKQKQDVPTRILDQYVLTFGRQWQKLCQILWDETIFSIEKRCLFLLFSSKSSFSSRHEGAMALLAPKCLPLSVGILITVEM